MLFTDNIAKHGLFSERLEARVSNFCAIFKISKLVRLNIQIQDPTFYTPTPAYRS